MEYIYSFNILLTTQQRSSVAQSAGQLQCEINLFLARAKNKLISHCNWPEDWATQLRQYVVIRMLKL